MQIPLGLLLIFLVVLATSTENDIEIYRSQYDKQLDKYEYCVKLIVACEKLRDKVENFSESDELNGDQETVDVALNKYKKIGCFPNGLSLAGLRSYWNLVAKWESQIHELFLLQNLFSVVEEHKNGMQMKVTFGKMQGWCPMYDDPQGTASTTTSTTSAKESSKQTSTVNPKLDETTKKNNVRVSVGNTTVSCKVSSDVSQWVRNEISGTLNMSSLIEKIFNLEQFLGEYRNQSCCSYKSIRDRVEIINDGIAMLEDLQDLKHSGKKDYSNIESDYHNLNSRLEHLRTGNGNYLSGKCCPSFSDNLKGFQANFQSNLNEFNPPQSNITLKGLLKNVTTLEDTCSQQQNQLTKSIQDLNNKRNNIDNICCGEENNKINLIENSLKDDMQATRHQKDLSENINSLRENLSKSNKTLSDTENMLGLEVKDIEKLKNECGKVSRIQASKTLIDGLSLNVSKLVNKLNDMELIRTVDLSKLDTPLNTLKELDTTFEERLTNNTKKHIEDIANLKNKFENVNLKYSNFHDYHELSQVAAKKMFEKYQKHHDDLNESIKAIGTSPEGSPRKDGENTDINVFEKELVNLTEDAIPKLAQDIKDRKKGFAGKVEEKDQQESITWFNEEIKRKKQQILERLDKLHQNKVDTEKIRQLETHILQLSERHGSLAKRIADRHEVVKQNVNEMNKRIAAASSSALSCQQDCSLDNFPSMDDLAKRVKVLEQQLKNYLNWKIGKI